MEHVIDAQGKKLGRIATQAAVFLMGKNTPAYVRNEAPDVKVKIINASKVSITEKKMKDHITTTHSPYRGGQKNLSRENIVGKKGYAEAFRIAIDGMLPKNKLKPIMLKNLTISE